MLLLIDANDIDDAAQHTYSMLLIACPILLYYSWCIVDDGDGDEYEDFPVDE